MNISNKSRLATFLLAFFLGGFGAHRFYVGKPGSAAAMLILTLTLVGAIVSGIWAIVDTIIALAGGFRDGDGRLVTNW